MESSPSFQPHSADEVAAFLRERAETGRPVIVRGGGSKVGFGRPLRADEAVIDISRIAGITLYQPDELVLTARPGTPIAEIAAAVAERGQCLAFEPPAFGTFFDNNAASTLGGAVATGWAGPRRIKAGAVRDHVLGATAVGGDGQLFRSGGRVVKNVTGFDLPKLLTGSHGTLAVLTEITIKVLPAPEVSRTIAVFGLEAGPGIRLLSDLLGGPFEVSGAAHLPPTATARSSALALRKAGRSTTLLRLEGFGPSVAERIETVTARCAVHDFALLDEADGSTAWQDIRDVAALVDPAHVVWRLSLPPSDAAQTVAAISRATPCEGFYDWGGGLVWLSLPAGAEADLIRGLLPGGHATLMRAPPEVRAATPVFQPPAPAMAALAARVKHAFDPRGILAPGFMQAEE
jgi:glycolate oxidase FAD binding subunit